MRDVITHRGPDEAGLHCDAHAALAHRRLSIVDLSTGQQPLSNEDGTVWVVFNGEIYNHARRARASSKRAATSTARRSDTETIVHAYEQWGDDCVHRFRGMFAFAIWDAPQRRLLLVRDRLGIKPLYWARTGDALLFGSEIKAILASGLVEPQRQPRPCCRRCSARATSPATDTLFNGIHKLLPGHLLVFERRRRRDAAVLGHAGRRQPATSTASPQRQLAERHVVAQFRELLDESVRLRLMSDVPLGMFLSGGIDSSAIAALMARMIDRPLQTFSVAFKDRAFNELEYAREVARAIGADAHEVVIDDDDFFGALPKLVWHEDEPIAHPSSVPLYFVSALARQHVTVVLTGEGSDELLAGYGKYPRVALELAGRHASTSAWCRRRSRELDRARRRAATAARRSARYARAVVPGDGPHAGGDVLRQLRVDPARRSAPAARAGLRAAATARSARTGRRSAYFNAPNGASTPARSPALRRHQDLSRRAADEAGPDEHGGVDREPRAVPRSQAGRVRRNASRRMEAVRAGRPSACCAKR